MQKASYGIKQTLKAWNKRIGKILIQLAFKKCTFEYGVFVQSFSNSCIMMICLYMDDLLITENHSSEVENLKSKIRLSLKWMTWTNSHSFFTWSFWKSNKAWKCINKSMWELLDIFYMIDCNIFTNPFETNAKLDKCNDKNKVETTMYKGSLRYVCNIRHVICYEIRIINKFMSEPINFYLAVTKKQYSTTGKEQRSLVCYFQLKWKKKKKEYMTNLILIF